MNIEKYIADRITSSKKDAANISKPIVKIGILGIILGLAVMILTISMVLGFKNEIIRKITGFTADMVIANINPGSNGEQIPITISKDSLALFKKLPYIKHIQPIAIKNGIIKTKTQNEGVLIKGINAEYDFSFLKDYLQEGELPDYSKEEVSQSILISESLASRLDLKLNQKMLVYFIVQHEVSDSITNQTFIKFEQRSRNFVICGIFKTSFSDFDNNLAFADLRQIQKLNYWEPHMAGNYEVRIKDSRLMEESASDFSENLGMYYQLSTVRDLYSNIFIWLDKLDINGVIIIVLMVVVAVINMITALLILILERTNMIGLLKSLGMSNVNVRKIFFYISMKLLSRGLIWGNMIGISLCLLQYYFKIVKLDPTTYYVDSVAIELTWLYYILLSIGTAVVCMLFLFIPTIIISKITPIKSIRFD